MYALVINDVIEQTVQAVSGPAVSLDGQTTLCSNIETLTDAQLTAFGWYPVTISGASNPTAGYTNTITYSLVNGLPIGTWVNTPPASPPAPTLAQAQATQTTVIMSAWRQALSTGSFTSVTVPGFIVNCRRSSAYNDLQDIQGLIALMQAGSAPTPYNYMGVSVFQSCTLAQIQSIANEMLGYGAQLFNRQHVALTAISTATDVPTVQAVAF